MKTVQVILICFCFLMAGCAAKNEGMAQNSEIKQPESAARETNYAPDEVTGIGEKEYKIYDIAQEVFQSEVYPGDPAPEKTILSSIENGDTYNLSAFSMCAHNGTHIDAPHHFIEDGKTVDQVSLDAFVGMAYVAEHQGIVTGEDAAEMLRKASEQNPASAKRILIKGDIEVTPEAANVFADSKIFLLGSELQTFGSEDTETEVHRILLGADAVLLEGARLQEVSEGVYFLSAVPLNLGGADGSPCRAVLIDIER